MRRFYLPFKRFIFFSGFFSFLFNLIFNLKNLVNISGKLRVIARSKTSGRIMRSNE